MKKLPIVMSMTMVAVGGGIMMAPMAWAGEAQMYADLAIEMQSTESAESVELIGLSEKAGLGDDVVNPLVEFYLIDVDNSKIGMGFNKENDTNLALRRVKLAFYNYDSYRLETVERDIVQMREFGRPTWALMANELDFEYTPGGEVERQEWKLEEGFFWGDKPGMMHYMVEYEELDTGELKQIYGKLNYRDCMIFANEGSTQVTSCTVSEKDGKWVYERVDPAVIGHVNSWKEELTDYLGGQIEQYRMEAECLEIFYEPEALDEMRGRIYAELLRIRNVLEDAERGMWWEIYEGTRDVYEILFGTREEVENPYEKPVPDIPLTPIGPGEPIVPDIPLTPLEPGTPVVQPERPTEPENPGTLVRPGMPVAPNRPTGSGSGVMDATTGSTGAETLVGAGGGSANAETLAGVTGSVDNVVGVIDGGILGVTGNSGTVDEKGGGDKSEEAGENDQRSENEDRGRAEENVAVPVLNEESTKRGWLIWPIISIAVIVAAGIMWWLRRAFRRS